LSLGLAPVVVQQLFRTIGEINGSGTTVLLVEQYVNLALKVAKRAYVLEKGTVALEGSASDLLDNSDIVRAMYLGRGASTGPPNGGTAARVGKRKEATRRGTPARAIDG